MRNWQRIIGQRSALNDGSLKLNPHSFDFIEAHLVGAPIIELGRACGGTLRLAWREILNLCIGFPLYLYVGSYS
jgi:hypothetical protein